MWRTNPPRVKASESVSGLTNQSSVTITETAIAEQVAFNAIQSVEVYDGATELGAATLSGETSGPSPRRRWPTACMISAR